MKGIHGFAGLTVLGIALAGAGSRAWAQPPAEHLPPAESLPTGPVLAPRTLPDLPEPAAPKPAAPPGTPVGRQEASVTLEWVGTSRAQVGRPADYTLAVRNASPSPVQQVLARVQLPPGARVTDSEPRANAEGSVLWWDLGTMAARQEKSLRIRLVPDGKGSLACNAWVTFTGAAALRVKVSEPKLALKVTAPEKAQVGDQVPFVLTVSNPGDGTTERVRLHITLSEGIEPAGLADLELAPLAPQEARSVQLVRAVRAGGEQRCECVAESSGDLRARDRACVNVVQPRLDVEVSGPKLRYLERKAVYALKVTNPGDGPATSVTVQDVIPAGFRFAGASDGGRHDPATQSVSWVLGEMGPGQSREVKLEVVAVSPGEQHHRVTAQADRGLKANQEVLTRVEALSALVLEVVDTEDPIEVGAETSYEIRITNRGSKPETDIKLVGILPDKVQFKSASGPSRFQQEGNQVIFEALPQLAPRADAIYRVNVKATAAGDVRFKAQLTSASLEEPVVEMESTRIYED